MTEQKLREMFKNKSNCYADSDDVVQAIDEDMFVTLVTEILELSHKNPNTPCPKCSDSTQVQQIIKPQYIGVCQCGHRWDI